MREYEWWEKILAGRILRDLAMCESVCDDLGRQVKELDEKYDELYERLLKCYSEKCISNKQIAKLTEDLIYFRGRVTQLTSALAEALVIPDLKPLIDLDEATIVKPREMAAFSGYNLLVADLEYYALPLETWEMILSLIQIEVKDALTRYEHPIADCDDWSLVMHAFVAIAMRKARFDRQSAFMIVWSRTHAYNAFIDTDGNIWLYEPQSDVIGDKLEEGTEPYNSRRIWFPHARVE